MENTEIEKKAIVILANTKNALLDAKSKMTEIVGEVQIKMKKLTIELERLDLKKLPEISENSPEIKRLMKEIDKIGKEISDIC